VTADQDRKETRAEFGEAVNMTPKELRDWLGTEESRSVGQVGDSTKSGSGGGESTGHRSGRHIVSILEKKVGDLTDADYQHMRKVVGYVARHSKQRPKDAEHSRWRASLMNWGHDPLKK
jgi:hypothetical protein